MKKIIIRILFTVLLGGVGTSGRGVAQIADTQIDAVFTLNGEFSDIKSGKVVLTYDVEGQRIVDSTRLENGRFSFSGSAATPGIATLYLFRLSERQRRSLYIESGQISVSGPDLRNADIRGGVLQTYRRELDQLTAHLLDMDEIQTVNEKWETAMQAGDTAKADQFAKLIRGHMAKREAIQDSFIMEHPDSEVSWDLVRRSASMRIRNPATFEPVFSALSPKFRESELGRRIRTLLDNTKGAAVGQVAPDFTQPDREGNLVSLRAFRGKYVLLDFWASWCVPCREENPNVLSAYEKFNDKNFEVVAVSIDDHRSNWLRAVEEDDMPWIHLSDLKGAGNEAAVLYGVTMIPENFLIDPGGHIIAKNLIGQELQEALSGIFEK